MLVAATAVESPGEYVGLLAAVILGALGGESVGFLLGRWFGPKIRDSRLGSRIGAQELAAGRELRRPARRHRRVRVALPARSALARAGHRRHEQHAVPTVPRLDDSGLRALGVPPTSPSGRSPRCRTGSSASSLHFAGYIFVGAIVVFVVVGIVIKKLLERSEARHWNQPGDGDATTTE